MRKLACAPMIVLVDIAAVLAGLEVKYAGRMTDVIAIASTGNVIQISARAAVLVKY